MIEAIVVANVLSAVLTTDHPPRICLPFVLSLSLSNTSANPRSINVCPRLHILTYPLLENKLKRYRNLHYRYSDDRFLNRFTGREVVQVCDRWGRHCYREFSSPIILKRSYSCKLKQRFIQFSSEISQYNFFFFFAFSIQIY